MTTGWDWSQIITIVIVVALVWLMIQIGKVIGKIITAAVAVFIVVYLGQSLGLWDVLPFACPSPMHLWNTVWPVIHDWISHFAR